MSLFTELKREIDKGREGKNLSIPLPYERLNNFIDISRHTMYTIAGESGSGKSSLVQDMFLIRPLEWYFNNRNQTDIKLSIIYFGMERKLYMYVCKWISRMIFITYGIYIPVFKILGRKKGEVLTEQEYGLICTYEEILDQWERDDVLICHEGSKNPSGISRYIEEFAKKYGQIESKKEGDILGTRKYIPNHPNHIVLIITDHISILSPEREAGEGQKKMRIDKFSSTMREARDLYGFSPVIVQQLNRNLSDVQRHKIGDLQPKLSDLADSSSTTHDSDIIIALFDPYRHIPVGEVANDPVGYNLKKLKDDKGTKYYRSLHLLKSSFSSDGISIGMALHPMTGVFCSMPKTDKMNDDIYTSIVSGQFFL